MSTTWQQIHTERAALADTIEALTPDQWAQPSWCAGWTVGLLVGHLLASAEQTPTHFLTGMVRHGMRFNALMDSDARARSTLSPAEAASRLRARTTTTNKPPAPTQAMLGEVVIHGEDLRRPLGMVREVPGAAVDACLTAAAKANVPVGGKRRIAGLSLVATDTGWRHGSGPEVSGPGTSLLLAMTGRAGALASLSGPGVATLSGRL